MVVVATTTNKAKVRQHHVFLACSCVLVVLAYGSVLLAHSFMVQCPSSTVVQDENNLARDVKTPQNNVVVGLQSSPPTNRAYPKTAQFIPNNCNSSMRGLEFDNIYASGKWFKGKGLRAPSDFYNDAAWPPNPIQQRSASGKGSSLGSYTTTSMAILKDTIHKYNVKSMIDIPCGDVNWIFDSYETDTLSVYIGLDISFGVIEVNEQRFAHHVNKHFALWDATECVLPKFQYHDFGTTPEDDGRAVVQPVDLVHVRDVIQHMTLEQGVKYFCNVFKSGASVMITTTFEDAAVNKGDKEGGFYENNLMLEPFSFPKGESCVATHPDHEKDVTCVYNLTEGWVQEYITSRC